MVRRSFEFAAQANATTRALASLPARQQLLKQHNLALVLRQIASAENLSRAQLAVRTGLTKATVSTLVDSLIEAHLVTERDPERGLVGRPASPLGLNPDGPAGLGVEINVDYVSACVVDLTGAVRWHGTFVSDNRLVRPELVMKKAARLAGRLYEKAENAGLRVVGLGVGVPGLVDFDGVLHRAPNLGLEGVAVAEVLGEMLGRPLGYLRCDNEANLAALAEHWFGGRDDLSDFVFVSGEIGVGAGIVIGGELFRGVRGLGGELGHVTVDPAGLRCSCGSRGCVETVAGQEALLVAAGLQTGRAAPTGAVDTLVERAQAKDAAALEALERAGRALGVALGAFLNVLDLPSVVLGGLYAQLAPWLVGPVTAELRDRVVNHSWSSIEVVVSSLGSEASVRGAAAISTRRIIDEPTEVLGASLARS
jgi:predicted NBD/HSP70 family sugar kinase